MKTTCHEFGPRGDIGLAYGRATITSFGPDRGWAITRICLYGAEIGSPERELDPYSVEFDRIECAVMRQDGDRIDGKVARLFDDAHRPVELAS